MPATRSPRHHPHPRSPQVEHLHGAAKGGGAGGCDVDAAPEKVLQPAHDHRGVVDRLDLTMGGGGRAERCVAADRRVASCEGKWGVRCIKPGEAGRGRRARGRGSCDIIHPTSTHLPAKKHLREGSCQAARQVVDEELHQLPRHGG